MAALPKLKSITKEKIYEEVNKAKGVNGVRRFLREYLSPGVRMAIAEQSPEFFLTYYTGFRLPLHQRKWIELWSVPYLLELAPRDHGKSWIFSYGMPLFEIYSSYSRSGFKSVDHRFLQVSKTDTQSAKFATQVRETIESNVLLKEDYGNIEDRREWGKEHFRCKRDTTETVEKDYTYEFVGVLGAITGGHFHRINCDDLLDDENTKTVDRTAAISNWFWGTIWNLKESYTKISVEGTRKNRRELYNELLESPVWQQNVERAIMKYPMIPDPQKPGTVKQGWLYVTTKKRKIEHPRELKLNEKIADVEILTDDYKVLWPSTIKVDNEGEPVIDPLSKKPVVFGWGIKELLLDRAGQGATMFDREKQNQVSSDEGSIFSKKYLNYFDNDELFFNPQDGLVYLVGHEETAAA
jgi:hypothetical protein